MIATIDERLHAAIAAAPMAVPENSLDVKQADLQPYQLEDGYQIHFNDDEPQPYEMDFGNPYDLLFAMVLATHTLGDMGLMKNLQTQAAQVYHEQEHAKAALAQGLDVGYRLRLRQHPESGYLVQPRLTVRGNVSRLGYKAIIAAPHVRSAGDNSNLSAMGEQDVFALRERIRVANQQGANIPLSPSGLTHARREFVGRHLYPDWLRWQVGYRALGAVPAMIAANR